MQPIDPGAIHYLAAPGCLHVCRETRRKPQLAYTRRTPAPLLGERSIQRTDLFKEQILLITETESLARGLIRQLVNERLSMTAPPQFKLCTLHHHQHPHPPVPIPSGGYSITLALECFAILWC